MIICSNQKNLHSQQLDLVSIIVMYITLSALPFPVCKMRKKKRVWVKDSVFYSVSPIDIWHRHIIITVIIIYGAICISLA